MPTSKICLLDDTKISIRAALQLRAEARAKKEMPLAFKCIECLKLVDPHREGDGSPAHFEHRAKNSDCSLSFQPRQAAKKPADIATGYITTPELALRTAGGDDYIRTKGGIVKGLALKHSLNSRAPEVIVVGNGPNIRARAEQFMKSGSSVPAYIKRGTNAWELIGQYRAVAYRTDATAIKRDGDGRAPDEVAGILYTERTDEVAINIRGGGFADPETRKMVELAAIAHVQTQFEAQGFTIHDHQRDNLGYDLLATKVGSSLKLEVKGTGGPVSRFFLTRNERKCATRDPHWRLAIVTNAKAAPQMQVLTALEMERLFLLEPLAWECTLLPT